MLEHYFSTAFSIFSKGDIPACLIAKYHSNKNLIDEGLTSS